VHAGFAFQVSQGTAYGTEEPRRVIANATIRSEDAVRADPENPKAHLVYANALWAQISYDMERRIDPGNVLDRAIGEYDFVIRLDPRFTWALTEAAQVHYQKMTRDTWLGRDVAPSSERVVELAERAMTLDTTSPIGPYTKALPHVVVAEQLVAGGKNPDERLGLALQSAEASRALAPKALLPIRLLFRIERARATYQSESGKSSAELFGKLAQCVKDLSMLAPDASETDESLGTLKLLEAEHQLRQKQDLAASLHAAGEAFDRVIQKDPRNLAARISRARVDIVGIHSALRERKATAAMFDPVAKLLEPVLAEERDDPSVYQTMAEMHALRAMWLIDENKTPDVDIEQGLAMATKALAKNPHLATALLAKSWLYSAKARATRDETARAEASRQAKVALEAAFRENPLLEKSNKPAFLEAVAAQ
jgi:hypothetical protein